MAEFGAPRRPDPWWYSRNPRRSIVIGLAVVLLCVLRLLDRGFTVVIALLGLVGVFQLVVAVLSIRLDVHRDLPPG